MNVEPFHKNGLIMGFKWLEIESKTDALTTPR